MRKPFPFLILVCLFLSCERDLSDQDQGELLEFDLDKLTTSRLTNDFELVKIVQLSSRDVLLGSIQNVEVSGDEIFILAGTKTNGIYKFSLDGEYLGKIGVAGNGPEEYAYIRNFAIDGNRVLVVDGEKRKVDLYTRDGKFRNTLKRDVFGLDIKEMPDNGFVLYSGNSTNRGLSKKLFFFDKKGGISSTEQDVDLKQAEFLNITPQKVFSRNGLYLESFSDKIFDISNGQLKPKYALSFGEHTLKRDDLDRGYDNIAVFLDEVRKKNKVILYSEFFETNNTLSFSFEYGGRGKRHHVFLNKDSLTYNMFSDYTEDYLTTGFQMEKMDFKLVGSTSDYFVFMINPYVLVEGEAEFSDFSMNIDDNPILMFLKIKE